MPGRSLRSRTAAVRAMLAAVALLAACSSETTSPEAVKATGTWQGSAQGVTLALTLVEDLSGQVTGDGTIEGPAGAVSVTVGAGTHTHPDIALTLSADGFSDIQLSGRFTNDNSIAATLDGSGFTAFAMTLSRH
jgi:hypothetical protein